jgi:hypothetical protein
VRRRRPITAALAPRRLMAVALAALCAPALGACAGTVQDQPIPHNILEGLIEAPFPVYWLGRSFQGMALSEATRDTSAAFTVQYGNCLRGGEGGCIPPLRVVSSPDNSFLPGGSTPARATRIRGVKALLAQGGKTIVLATGGVVVDVYALNARMALAAARMLVPINAAGAPEAPLAPALATTRFNERPLPAQLPAPLRPLG